MNIKMIFYCRLQAALFEICHILKEQIKTNSAAVFVFEHQRRHFSFPWKDGDLAATL
jgi:hypothetical protein